MNQRQTVYQNRDIIAVIIVAAVLHILVDNLQTVVRMFFLSNSVILTVEPSSRVRF